MISRALCFTFAPLTLALPLCADRVLTKDGRVLAPKKARVQDAGYRIVFENGEILLKDKALVQSVEIEGDMSEYVPQNADETDKLAHGYVKYHGKWLIKAAYEEELRKEFEKSKARTAELAAHSDWDHAYTKDTAHFSFHTNTSKELLDYYAELLEAYYALQNDRIGINPTPSMRRTKMAVNVYKSYEDFQENAHPGNPAVLGFFSPGAKSLNFYHEYTEPAQTQWVALHECTHLITYLIDQQYVPQIWLNEGVADYYGSSKIERDKAGKLVITPGQLQTDRVLTVQQALKHEGGDASSPRTGGGGSTKKSIEGRPFTPLETLFKLSHDEFDGFQYAHSWAFVYFLNNFENGKYQKLFQKFFKSLYTLDKSIPYETVNYGPTGAGKLASPETIRTFLLKGLGLKDSVQLEKDWKSFIAAIPIEGPTARLKRGLYEVRTGDFEGALADLNAAIEGGIKDPRAYWARGKAVAIVKGPKEGISLGIKDLEQAVEMDPLDALYRYDLSRMQVGHVSLGGRGPGGKGVLEESDGKKFEDPKAKAQAGLASELDPDNDRYREWFSRFE